MFLKHSWGQDKGIKVPGEACPWSFLRGTQMTHRQFRPWYLSSVASPRNGPVVRPRVLRGVPGSPRTHHRSIFSEPKAKNFEGPQKAAFTDSDGPKTEGLSMWSRLFKVEPFLNPTSAFQPDSLSWVSGCLRHERKIAPC